MIVVEARVMDATHLELTRPIDTPPGGKVFVSLLDSAQGDRDRDDWIPRLSRSRFIPGGTTHS